MKKYYRKGQGSYSSADLLRHDSPRWRWERRDQKTLKKKYAKTLTTLEEAKTEITRLVDEMKVATDLPETERNYYAPFMESHIGNIDKWIEQTNKFLGILEGNQESEQS